MYLLCEPVATLLDLLDYKKLAGSLTHVLQGSDPRAELLEEEWVVDLSAAKVNDLDDVHVSDNDVLRLDVQMKNASGMEVVQALEDLRNVGHHVILRVTEPENQQAHARSDFGDAFLSHQGCFSASPVNEAEQQLFPTAVLGDEHQVARRDIRLVQSHDSLMVKGLEDLIFLQHLLLALCLVRNDFCQEEVSCGIFPALADHAEPSSAHDKHRKSVLKQPHQTPSKDLMFTWLSRP